MEVLTSRQKNINFTFFCYKLKQVLRSFSQFCTINKVREKEII